MNFLVLAGLLKRHPQSQFSLPPALLCLLTMSSGEYMIFHPEKASLLDLLVFLFINSNLPQYDFVDTNVTTKQETSFAERLLIVGTFIYIKLISSVSDYWDKFTAVLEYALNSLSLNGGLLGFIRRSLTVTGSIVTPQPGNVDYRSIHSFINGPIVLDKMVATMIKDASQSHQDVEMGSGTGSCSDNNRALVELAISASSLAYENAKYIENVVDNEWQMDFVEFFEGWNFYINDWPTVAFVFCDKATDPSLIVVAFRGAVAQRSPKAHFDFSWIDTKVMGKVHVGILEALGLQDNKKFADGFPADYIGTRTLAYYSITAKLTELVTKYSSAKILVAGHSLGGALAVVFTSLLSYHNQKNILDKIEHVYTFGQLRVGDATFAEYMNSLLGDKYRRMVYRFDLFPRIPFDLPFLMASKHFGTCVQYEGWFKGTMGTDVMPDKNYFNPLYLPQIYWGYLVDFAVTIWWGITRGEWEGWPATINRIKCVLLPGIVFHQYRNYINASIYADVTYKIKT